MRRQSRASHPLNRRSTLVGTRRGVRAEFMLVAVHPPSPTPRSYLAKLSRSAIPPNHHRECRHETDRHTHTQNTRNPVCQPPLVPVIFPFCFFFYLSKISRGSPSFSNLFYEVPFFLFFTIFMLLLCFCDNLSRCCEV